VGKGNAFPSPFQHPAFAFLRFGFMWREPESNWHPVGDKISLHSQTPQVPDKAPAGRHCNHSADISRVAKLWRQGRLLLLRHSNFRGIPEHDGCSTLFQTGNTFIPYHPL